MDDFLAMYNWYFEGVPQADKVLAAKLPNKDFKDFLFNPIIPRKKPDITTFIHLPVEVRSKKFLNLQIIRCRTSLPPHLHEVSYSFKLLEDIIDEKLTLEIHSYNLLCSNHLCIYLLLFSHCLVFCI